MGERERGERCSEGRRPGGLAAGRQGGHAPGGAGRACLRDRPRCAARWAPHPASPAVKVREAAPGTGRAGRARVL